MNVSGSMSQERSHETLLSTPKKKILLKKTLMPLTDRQNIRKHYYPILDEKQNNETDLYQTVIELFPPTHPIWNDLLEKSQTIEEVIQSNNQFFLGLVGLYLQQSELQALKDQIQQKTVTSQYLKDYKKLKEFQVTHLDPAKAHDQMWGKNLKQLYNQSVYNSQYVPHSIERIEKKQDFSPKVNEAYSFISSYQSQYQNWKPQYPGKITHREFEKLTLPFISESSYAREFKNFKLQDKSPNKNKMNVQLGPFAQQPESLIKESTSSYYMQQTNQRIPSKLMRPLSPKLFNASFEGQYLTESNKQNINYVRSYKKLESSFTSRFYESNSVKQIFDKKIDRKIY